MPRLPITAFSFDRPRPRIFFVVGLVSVLVALGGIGVAAWTVTEPRLDPAEVPESVRAVADVAEAAREARYVLTAAASGDTRAREAGAPYVAACFTRLAGAAERSRDPTTLGLVATLPARPVDRLDTATAALDAIAAYTDRRVAEARIEASLGALSDATRVGRIASALAGVAVLGVLVVLGVATAATSNYERAIQAAIPEETAGRTDADRVAFLAGRLSRARRVADRGRMTADELADTLDSVAASRREYQALVESQAELLRSREVELREKDRALLQDEKTALWRFSHLQVEVKLAIERWIADREPFCLVALDLNRFKSINETYGHTAGDAAILDVAEMLRAASRDADVACRRGGDEFMALFPVPPKPTASRSPRASLTPSTPTASSRRAATAARSISVLVRPSGCLPSKMATRNCSVRSESTPSTRTTPRSRTPRAAPTAPRSTPSTRAGTVSTSTRRRSSAISTRWSFRPTGTRSFARPAAAISACPTTYAMNFSLPTRPSSG